MPTEIEWTDETTNPIKVKGGGWHCTKVSAGCSRCYSERINKRFGNGKPYDNAPTEYMLDKKALTKVLSWRKPKRIFWQSMSDLFHPDIEFQFIVDNIIETIIESPQHTHLFLTKHPGNMKDFFDLLYNKLHYSPIPAPNLHLGVSISTNDDLWMVDELLQIPAAVRWISVEPIFGAVDLTAITLEDSSYNALTGICNDGIGHLQNVPGWYGNKLGWVVCGFETGSGARPGNLDDARNLRDQCRAAGVPFFFKSAGPGIPTPPDLMIREMV
jgi:protein gp37